MSGDVLEENSEENALSGVKGTGILKDRLLSSVANTEEQEVAKSTVHSITAQTRQERIKRTKAKEYQRTCCSYRYILWALANNSFAARLL